MFAAVTARSSFLLVVLAASGCMDLGVFDRDTANVAENVSLELDPWTPCLLPTDHADVESFRDLYGDGESFHDYATVREAVLREGTGLLQYAGACAGGNPIFLESEHWLTWDRLYYDSETGEFLGFLYFADGGASCRGWYAAWPRVIQCEDDEVTEDLLNEAGADDAS